MRIGPSFCTVCKMISVNGVLINYVEKLKYLGCVLVSDKSFKVSLYEMRVKFYKSFNSLYSKCFKFREPVLLHFINAHWKSFLLYEMEAVNLSNRELNTLNYRPILNAICKICKVSHATAVSKTFCIIRRNLTSLWLLDVKKDATRPKGPNCKQYCCKSCVWTKHSAHTLTQCFPTCVPRHTSVPRER